HANAEHVPGRTPESEGCPFCPPLGFSDGCGRMTPFGVWSLPISPRQRRDPMMITPSVCAILLTTVLAWSPPGEAPGAAKPVSFRPQDFRGAWHQLNGAGDGKVAVVAFLGTECPLASLYAPRLAELARTYEKNGVAFFGVDSNSQDAPSALSRFAREHDL